MPALPLSEKENDRVRERELLPDEGNDNESPLRKKAKVSWNSGKNVSSYKIFTSFIKPLPASGTNLKQVDVSEVFTKKCFQLWLTTRTTKIKHPEQSFQRALYAHIRGADGRKPFPENVEKAFLEQLRGVSKGEEKNPWTRMFGENDLKLGKKGFKKQGFHEKLRQDNSPASHEDYNGRQVNPSTFSKPGFQPSPANLSHLASISNSFKTNMQQTPFEALCQVVQTYIPPQDQRSSFLNSASISQNLFSPEFMALLGRSYDALDYRFRWDFLIPAPSEQVFLPSKPVAQLILMRSQVCEEENEAANEMFKGSFVGRHILERIASLESFMFTNIKAVPILATTGVAWVRVVMLRDDGSKGVFLVRNTFDAEKDRFVMCLQDHSEMFAQVLKSPFFS